MTHALWLRKQFLLHMKSRHWLISFRRFKEMFFETADDKSVIFFITSKNLYPVTQYVFPEEHSRLVTIWI